MSYLKKCQPLVLGGALLLAVSASVYAQEDKPAEKEGEKPAQQEDKAQAEPAPKPKAAQETGKEGEDTQSPEDFIPTEEISEDLSVSFPIDI